MPRPNRGRDVYAEEHVARRIMQERDARGWTNEGLAQRMTQVGCPLNQSAIYKIEHSRPRRRITVDELAAFSRVFDIPVQRLLIDPDLDVDERVSEALEEWRSLTEESIAFLEAHSRKMTNVRNRLRALVSSSEAAERALRGQLQEMFPDDPAAAEGFIAKILPADDGTAGA